MHSRARQVASEIAKAFIGLEARKTSLYSVWQGEMRRWRQAGKARRFISSFVGKGLADRQRRRRGGRGTKWGGFPQFSRYGAAKRWGPARAREVLSPLRGWRLNRIRYPQLTLWATTLRPLRGLKREVRDLRFEISEKVAEAPS